MSLEGWVLRRDLTTVLSTDGSAVALDLEQEGAAHQADGDEHPEQRSRAEDF